MLDTFQSVERSCHSVRGMEKDTSTACISTASPLEFAVKGVCGTFLLA